MTQQEAESHSTPELQSLIDDLFDKVKPASKKEKVLLKKEINEIIAIVEIRIKRKIYNTL